MKVRYFVVISIILGVMAIVCLRLNGLAASDLRAKVVQADTNGQDTAPARQVLAKYVAKHMGSSMGLELTTSFNRDTSMATKAANGGEANGAVYAAAQAACKSTKDSIVQAKCVAGYVASHSTPAEQPKLVALPDRASYIYHYNSPIWTADLAGWSLILSILSIAIAIIAGILRLCLSKKFLSN